MSITNEELRAALLEERAQLLHRIDELTIGGEVDLDYDSDFADRGQVAGEQTENLTWAESLQHQVDLVEQALARMDEGTYGACVVCGAPIAAARLETLPATPYCLEHAAGN